MCDTSQLDRREPERASDVMTCAGRVRVRVSVTLTLTLTQGFVSVSHVNAAHRN